MALKINSYDVIIVGAGLTGLTLAHALAQQNLSIAIVEKNALPEIDETATNTKTDGRALALSLSAQRILQNLGLWQHLESYVTAIKAVHVSEQGCYGKVRLCATDMEWPALGYIVPYPCLGENLLRAVKASSQIKIFTQTKVVALNETEATSRSVLIHNNAGEEITLSGSLVIVAEGNAANISETLGFVTQETPRAQHAIVADITLTQPHYNIAYQRFTDNGILAILPRAKNKITVVWTVADKNLSEWNALSDKDWLQKTQSAFGYKLGFFKEVGPRHHYPIKQFVVENPYQARLLLLGNAAHTLSPVAAQGFNLTLRDIALLVQLLAKARQAQTDLGSLDLLKEYQTLRADDQKSVYALTDKLIAIFSWPYLKGVRSLGLLLCDRFPLAKKTLIKRAEGLTGIPSRLMYAELE